MTCIAEDTAVRTYSYTQTPCTANRANSASIRLRVKDVGVVSERKKGMATTGSVSQLLRSYKMKVVLPQEVYDIIGDYAGDKYYRLGFTLTPKRKELSAKVWIVARKKYVDGKGWVYTKTSDMTRYRLRKDSWVAVTMKVLLGRDSLGRDRLDQLCARFEGTSYEQDANALTEFCNTVLQYNLCPEGLPHRFR